jgi:hypothetical protein
MTYEEFLKRRYGLDLEDIMAGPSEPRPPDQSNLPALIDTAAAASRLAQPPDDGPRPKGLRGGIGALKRAPWFALAQMAWGHLSPEQKEAAAQYGKEAYGSLENAWEAASAWSGRNRFPTGGEGGLQWAMDLLGFSEPEPLQRISSKATSVKQISAIFKSPKIFDLKEGSVNLDIGGGRFDLGTDYLRNERGVENLVFDRFNRSSEHNKEVLSRVQEIGGADSATVANTLNVIEEPEARRHLIQQSYGFTKKGGKVFFQIYEGDRTGAGGETTKGWQNNKKTLEYIPEIEKVFGKGNVQRKGNIIIAVKTLLGQGGIKEKARGGFVVKPLYDDTRTGGII